MKTAARLLVLTGVVSLLAACQPGERVREIDWAKAALARNPAYEILSVDESAGIFTVRDTSSGATRTLRLEDLVAGPVPPKSVTVKPAAPAPDALPVATPDTPVENAEPESAGEPVLAHQPVPAEEQVRAAPASGGDAVAEGPGYSISRGGQAPAAANLEGPGYSITRHDAAKPVASTNNRGAEAVAANVERRSDPIVCQGDRLMRIDGETIEFTGDAVIAEKGCDLYISNARIRAGGVGIIARQARVHIVNSTIGGSRGSYEASDGAEIYVARSTFAGVGRRFDNATMNDLGGNSYEIH
ncbi:MAG TPA: hypothetical protein VMF52_15125 [Steroidobacteraceae bacterium]|nr:hypothetical protein [Steroidobacteraceae bacterium]